MDLKVFYQKMRQVEASLPEADVVIVSLETPDGGRAGAKTEAPRAIAARMITEGTARLATAEEASEFRQQRADALRRAEEAAASNKVQFTVLSEPELRALRGGARPPKG